MKKIALTIALFLGWSISIFAQAGGVSVQTSLDSDQYLPDEDLRLIVRVTNLSGQPLTLGQDNNWISFSLIGENGLPVERLSSPEVAGAFSMQSAEVAKRTINLTPYFNFRRPGKYRLIATVNILQWNKQISSKPIAFMVMNGVPVASVPEIQFGVPTAEGAANAAPEVRRYSLLKVLNRDEAKLYFRLSDEAGKPLRVFPIDKMISFSQPEAQIDRFNNYHVISQVGAKGFTYCEINPFGQILARQTYDYTRSRPELAKDSQGHIVVTGGVRRVTPNDLPPPTVLPPPTQDVEPTK